MSSYLEGDTELKMKPILLMVEYFKCLIQLKNMSLYKLIIFVGIIGLIISIIFALIFNKIYKDFNIFQYFSDLNSSDKFYVEIFVVSPIFIFSKYLQMYLEILIIYYLNPIYVLAANDFTYGISKLIKFISDDFEHYENFLFAELTEISALLGNIVFLEIVELNFCGLSDNIRRNIKSKGELDVKELFIVKKPTLDKEEDEDDNDNVNKIREVYD